MADDNQNKMKDEVVPDTTPFDPTKKKKKKKVVFQDTTEESVDKLAKKTENLAGCSIETSTLNEDSGDAVEDLNERGGEGEEGEGIVLDAPSYPWEGSDRDYTYEELLDRVFNIRRENNPYLAGDMRRIVLRPPQVLREGTKKTILVDFMDQCKRMHREPSHLMAFLLSELGTSGSLDGQQRLVVKGRFAPKNFETVLRGYVNQYVQCDGCKSPDTILSKENRLFRLRCEECGADRTVTPIKAGFVARVGRRNAGT